MSGNVLLLYQTLKNNRKCGNHRNVSGNGRNIMWELPGGTWQDQCQKPGLRYGEKSYVDISTPPPPRLIIFRNERNLEIWLIGWTGLGCAGPNDLIKIAT